jgi:ABC-type amino acid transport substrate-binding protein
MRGKRIFATFTALVLLLCISACGNTVGGYQQSGAGLGDRSFSICCREGDPLLDTLIAALQVRKADGTTARLSGSWFGSDLTEFKGDALALSGIEAPAERVLLLGYDESAYPFAGSDERGKPRGFEMELAESVCELLGWELRALPIDPAQIQIELASGEVDVVWGGVSFDGAKGVRAMQYMRSEYVIVSRAEAAIRSVRGLQGKTLSYPPCVQKAAEEAGIPSAAETAVKLADTEACFTAMKAGRCDAVLTDAVSAAYFSR